DLIVASPAVPTDHPLLVAAEAAGVSVTTEIGLFWAHCRGRIIGVTGSVGKSTTAAMIHAALVGSGRTAWLGGNIGGSLLPDVDRIAADDWVVLELSSFQLERLGPQKPRPRVAVVTNLRPNHLDRHGTLAAYRAAKQNLLRWQTAEDVAVLNADDPDVSTWPTAARVRRFGTWREEPPPGAFLDGDRLVVSDGRSLAELPLSLRVPGEHHRLNAAAAVAAATAVGVEPQVAVDALNGFRGLPHRLEVLGEIDGRLWVNDSKATTPESAVAALRSFDRPVRLIAGGADKGVDLSPLADQIAARDAAVYLSGRTGPVIAELLARRGHRAVTSCETFDESVTAAHRDSRPGDVILLSPGCASWGQFRDYRERGERFAELARTEPPTPGSEGEGIRLSPFTP
ncbi:MAG TPA: UDP-N-acetylmuramoyl-L-alanine--D-glutamate ligase, partial [Planctomycetaceae bacterium]